MAYKHKDDAKKWRLENKEQLKLYAQQYFQAHRDKFKQPRLYKIWAGMKERCNNTNNPAFALYGGRNIKVCDRWISFKNFELDMKENYQENLTLDRINNDEGYYKKNCKWSTWEEQANNKSNNKPITHQGTSLTLNQWGRKIGVKPSAMRTRYYSYKWPVEKLLKEANFGSTAS